MFGLRRRFDESQIKRLNEGQTVYVLNEYNSIDKIAARKGIVDRIILQPVPSNTNGRYKIAFSDGSYEDIYYPEPLKGLYILSVEEYNKLLNSEREELEEQIAKLSSKIHIIDGIIQEVQSLLQENNQQVCDESISIGRAKILK